MIIRILTFCLDRRLGGGGEGEGEVRGKCLGERFIMEWTWGKGYF